MNKPSTPVPAKAIHGQVVQERARASLKLALLKAAASEAPVSNAIASSMDAPKAFLAALLLGGAISGCAVSQVKTLSEITPPSGEIPLMTVAAQGVQIYECRVEQGRAAAWTFVAPEAELFDGNGRRIGTHGAGPFWQHEDGSRIVGTVRARVDASRPADIPWLLLATRPQLVQAGQIGQAGPLAAVSQQGVFARVSSVQRVNTVGGQAPADGCNAATLGKRVGMAYRADYVLHVPQNSVTALAR